MLLDARQTTIAAILVLLLGKYLNRKIPLFKHYSIPEPVTGGLIASLLVALVYGISGTTIEFTITDRDALLVIFFTCVGLSSQLTTLLQGGRSLITLLILAVVYLFVQNLTGIGVALSTGLSSQVGVLGGSVSLSGGHGTAIAWAPVFSSDYGISNAMEIGVACATFGLVLGGVVGGPIANYLVKRNKLTPTSDEALTVGIADEKQQQITVDSLFSFLLILCIAIGIGIELHELAGAVGLNLPIFVPCLFGGILLTNTVPYIWKKLPWPTGTPTLALVTDFCLGLFLAKSLMTLQLWTLVDLALPILLLLAAQVAVITCFTVFLVFRLLGRNYDAAIMASGYAGLALGATPTAIANMTAVTKKFGPSPQAFIVVPLIGAFFVDISNAIIVQTLLGWLE